ncbi:MAG: DUF1732 domain-containing protein, partial [Planctomycetota bacterium]
FDIENKVKKDLFRGTVYLSIKEISKGEETSYIVSQKGIEHYLSQIRKISKGLFKKEEQISLETLLSLPGVIVPTDREPAVLTSKLEKEIIQAFERSLQKTVSMRNKEGKKMERELKGYLQGITKLLRSIEKRLPKFLKEYQKKLEERISTLLQDQTLLIEPKDMVRELALFADKTDISEEILRMKSHIQQFKETLKEKGSIGRKLEFIAQEMLREANTMGAKTSDVEALNQIVEIKSFVDKIKEQVQNIE